MTVKSKEKFCSVTESRSINAVEADKGRYHNQGTHMLPPESKSASPSAKPTSNLCKLDHLKRYDPKMWFLIRDCVELASAQQIYQTDNESHHNQSTPAQTNVPWDTEIGDSKRENVAPLRWKQPQLSAPRMYVNSCTERDVLADRGNHSLRNKGNRWYLEERNSLQSRYFAADRIAEKSDIVQVLINRVRDRGGRFLRFDKNEGRWYELDEQLTRRKVGQALREKSTAREGKSADLQKSEIEAKSSAVEPEILVDACVSARAGPLEEVHDGDARALALAAADAIIEQNTSARAHFRHHQLKPMHSTPNPPSKPALATTVAASPKPVLMYVDSYNERDVLADRGNQASRNKGNSWYLEERNSLQARYLAAERPGEKGDVAQKLISRVRDRGGRFLRFDKKQGRWYELDEQATRKKVSQALREKLPTKDKEEKSADDTRLLQKSSGQSNPATKCEAKSSNADRHRKHNKDETPIVNRDMAKAVLDAYVLETVINVLPELEAPRWRQQAPMRPAPIPPVPQPHVLYFDSYTERDILADRGNHSSRNPGNIRYVEERNRLQARYASAERIGEKGAIAQELIAAVRDQGGRFLRFDKKKKSWYELDEQATRRKVCQAFREKSTAKAREENRRKYNVTKPEPTKANQDFLSRAAAVKCR